MLDKKQELRIKAFAIIDTNVIVSSLISSDASPRRIIELVKSGNICTIYDDRMLAEYCDVLFRNKFNVFFTHQEASDIIYTVVDSGYRINDVAQTKEDFKDIDDIPFFEVMESSSEVGSYLVTENIKDFPLQKSQIFTPGEMIGILNYMNTFVLLDKGYDKAFENIKNQILVAPKYTKGSEINKLLFNLNERPDEKLINDDYFER